MKKGGGEDIMNNGSSAKKNGDFAVTPTSGQLDISDTGSTFHQGMVWRLSLTQELKFVIQCQCPLCRWEGYNSTLNVPKSRRHHYLETQYGPMLKKKKVDSLVSNKWIDS